MANKYETAFCNYSSRSVSADEIKRIKDSSIVAFTQDYKEALVCPVCRQAKMTFVDGLTPHFRLHRNDRHTDNCIFSNPELTQDEITKTVVDNASQDAIDNQIDRLLSSLISPLETAKLAGNSTNIGKSVSVKAKNRSVSFNRRFPQKRFDQPLSDEDFGVYKIFYGLVNVRFEHSGQGMRQKHRICFFSDNEGRFIGKLIITHAVYTYLPTSIISNGSKYVAFFGQIERSEKGYFKGLLMMSNYLKIVQAP